MKTVTIFALQEISPLINSRVFAERFIAGKLHPSHYHYFNNMKPSKSNASVSIDRGVSREFAVAYLSSA